MGLPVVHAQQEKIATGDAKIKHLDLKVWITNKQQAQSGIYILYSFSLPINN